MADKWRAQRRASAGVLRQDPMQARHDSLIATLLAGCDYRQVYFTQKGGAVGGRLQRLVGRRSTFFPHCLRASNQR